MTIICSSPMDLFLEFLRLLRLFRVVDLKSRTTLFGLTGSNFKSPVTFSPQARQAFPFTRILHLPQTPLRHEALERQARIKVFIDKLQDIHHRRVFHEGDLVRLEGRFRILVRIESKAFDIDCFCSRPASRFLLLRLDGSKPHSERLLITHGPSRGRSLVTTTGSDLTLLSPLSAEGRWSSATDRCHIC